MVDQDAVIVGCNFCGAKNRVPTHRLRDRAVCGRCKRPISLDTQYPHYPVVISDQTFEKDVLKFPGPVVVYYWASWCGYCRQLTPIIEQLAREYAGRLKFTKLILDQNPVMASQYGVQSVPTLILFNRGRQVDRIVGTVPKEEIERHLRNLL